MSKFEPIPLDTLPCCACCKHLDRSVVYTSNPPKFMCKLFHDYVTGDRRTCLEDNPKRTVPPQEQGAWTANDLVNRLHDFAQKAVYEGVRGGGGSFLPPEGYINGKEREIRARLGRIEKRLEEQGEKKNGMDKWLVRLEGDVQRLEWHLEEHSNNLGRRIKQLGERLCKLETERTCYNENGNDLDFVCSNCKFYVSPYDHKFKRCPNCEAKIVKRKEEKKCQQ